MAEQRRQTLDNERRTVSSTARSMNKTTVRPGQPAVHPQSPLQPVYNVINVLRPDHIIRSYKRLNRRQRWAIIMSFASIVAMIAILTASIAPISTINIKGLNCISASKER